ncbi:MAG TPA: energy transducer TonB [Spirochaetia bacterium]|nr:energy transducer TonB [Spirochaetia bacterium]
MGGASGGGAAAIAGGASGATGAPDTGAAVGSTGSPTQGLLPPRPVFAIRPAYPRSARLAGAQGLVKVEVLVRADGTVSGASVTASSGSAALDEAARQAVLHARFSPATQDGVPVDCRVVVPIRFQLSSSP